MTGGDVDPPRPEFVAAPAPADRVATRQPIALDIHAHLAPAFPEFLGSIAGVSFDERAGVLTVDGHRVGVAALYRPDELVAWMDREGVERALISVPPPLYRNALRGNEAVAWSAYLTNGLQTIAERWPDRLSPLAHIPADDPTAAATATTAAVAQGYRHFSLPAGGIDASPLSDPGFEALWQALEAVEAFALFHPGECADGRLSAFYLGNLLGNPYETTVAIAHLVFGGVVERHPAIRFCFAHGGGAAPMLAGRFARGVQTARPGIAAAQRPPRDLLRSFCVDCIVHDAAALDLAEATFGADHVLFGSDWPFPMGLPDPHGQLRDITAERRRRIFCDNPRALFPALFDVSGKGPA